MTQERMLRDNFKGCRCCSKTEDQRCDDQRRARIEIRLGIADYELEYTDEVDA